MGAKVRKELNVHLSNQKAIKRVIDYCDSHKMRYNDFVGRIINEWFDSRDGQLENMTKEELLDLIKSGEVKSWI